MIAEGAKKQLFLDDILKVIYAPHKVFKSIVANPKYLGALVVLLLFIGLQVGYEYAQFDKTYTEQTSPTIDQLSTYTNATYWRAANNTALTNDVTDNFNYSVYVAGFGLPPSDSRAYYNLFGNFTPDALPSSLEISAANTNNISAAIDNAFNVDCSTVGFQNLSMTMKLNQPQTPPTNATITLYALSDTDYYTYDLMNDSSFSNAAINQWTNLTLTIGPNSQGWVPSGNPTWNNITALKLDLAYPQTSNITVHIGALFFRGEYLTPIQYNSVGVLLQFLQLFSLQYILGWFLITILIYALCRWAVKNPVVWKPLFVALGFAMFVMVIRALVNLAATTTMPAVYYPYDLSLGVRFDPYAALYYPSDALGNLSLHSQAIFTSISAATEAFRTIVSAMFIISYVWLGVLVAMVVKALKPEFSTAKCAIFSGVSIAITVLLLLFLVGAV